MDKDLDRRPKSAAAVAKTLRQCLNHLHDPANNLPAELQKPSGLPLGRGAALLSIAVVIVIGSALGLAKAMQKDANVSIAPVIPSKAIPIGDSPIRWDDGVESSLQELADEVQRFEESL